jgi:hypothetical protein
MGIQVTIADREFTVSEAATISGVSPTLQRDWRRRGLIAERDGVSRASFTLKDVVRMFVMKQLSDAKVAVKANDAVCGLALLPILGLIEQVPGAVETVGEAPTAAIKARIADASAVRRDPGDFIVYRPGAAPTRVESIDHWLNTSMLEPDVPFFFVLNCRSAASTIVARAEGPVIRREIAIVG